MQMNTCTPWQWCWIIRLLLSNRPEMMNGLKKKHQSIQSGKLTDRDISLFWNTELIYKCKMPICQRMNLLVCKGGGLNFYVLNLGFQFYNERRLVNK